MNKLFSTLLLAATFAGSASAYSYTTPGVAGALTPYDMQPTYSLEALYGIAADSADPDMYGARLGFSLYNNAQSNIRHQFGLYLAYLGGSESYTDGAYVADVDTNMMPLTFGYDVNFLVTDNIMIDLGAKAGYAMACTDVTLKDSATGLSGKDNLESGGFTYSVGAAVKFVASDSIQVKLGYEYSRTYLEGDYLGQSFKQTYGAHIISLGASVTF
ncbi:MAG: outer membrane beta-barrel protein [Akkermansia sp.]